LRILLCLVGQDETTKKKSPETTNNRPARDNSGGSTHLPAQISFGGATCHRLRAAPGPARVPWAPAPTSRRRTTLGAPRVTGSWQHPPPGADQLRGRRVSPAHGSSGPARVSWTPTPTSRRRTALGAPRVPAAPGRRKNVGPSSSETKLWTIFLAPAARRGAAPGASRVPAALSRMKTVEPMQKT
jgi:hypothetical protein